MDILLQSFRNHQKVRGNPIRPLQTQLEHTVQRALTSKCTKRQCARVYKYEYKNTHTYIYIYIYIYTHTHEYTQPATIQLQPPPPEYAYLFGVFIPPVSVCRTSCAQALATATKFTKSVFLYCLPHVSSGYCSVHVNVLRMFCVPCVCLCSSNYSC